MFVSINETLSLQLMLTKKENEKKVEEEEVHLKSGLQKEVNEKKEEVKALVSMKKKVLLAKVKDSPTR